MRSRILVVAVASALSAFAVSAQASSSVVGGSTLLDAASVETLAGWLGKGDVVLTNIFTKTPGATSFDFHAAVDGQGPTISVWQATGYYTRAIVGGYNPNSWTSDPTLYNMTYDFSTRVAFIFNLTDRAVYTQRTDDAAVGASYGIYQTYNSAFYGPTFGGGHDLYVDGALGYGYSYLFSYSTASVGGYPNYVSIVDGNNYPSYAVGNLEVFRVTPVPEPETYALLLAGLGALGGIARRRRAQTT